MLVANWMSRDLVTASPDTSLHEAMRLLEKNRIRRLPVVKKKKLVGMVTERDLKAAYPSAATLLSTHELPYLLDKVRLRELMTKDPVTIEVYDTVEEAADTMMTWKIGGLPVMDEDHLVGIITESDVFRAMVSVTGLHPGGIQYALILDDRPGSIKNAADVIRRFGGRLVSILTSYDQMPEGKRMVYIRSKGLDRSRLNELQEDLSRVGRLLYVLDGRDKKKQLFTSPESILLLGEKRHRATA
jgi:acetoin utilization protein AcuB